MKLRRKPMKQKTGKELTKDEWRKIKDEQDDSENGIIAKARGTAVGRFLFGANDENGDTKAVYSPICNVQEIP